MPDGTLRAALVGAGGFGSNALEALRHAERIELTGLSDRDRAVAEASAAEAGCPAYHDHRRLLVETRPEAVFLAIPPAPAAEVVRLAAKSNASVWQQAPLARNLPEAVELARMTGRSGARHVVAAQRRFMGTYRKARELLGQLGRPFLIQAHYLCNFGPSAGWRGDKAAGGGALMELGYHMFDLVVWMLGLPEYVYSVVSNIPASARPPDQPVYDSEDTAVVIFRYRDNTTATVTASRCFSPVSEGLTAYCEGGVLTVDAGRCVVRDRDGKMLDSFQAEETPGELFARMIDDFVEAVDAKAGRYPASAFESLLTAAAVSAAYLSDQTNQPEMPARLLRNYDVTTDDCMKAAPTPEAPREAK